MHHHSDNKQNGPRMDPKWTQNGPKMDPKWTQMDPKWTQNGHKMDPKWEEADFGQSRFGHPDLTNFGQSNFGQSIFWPIQFWPIQFWNPIFWPIFLVSWWGPEGWGPEGWGPERWGPKISRFFFPSRHSFFFFLVFFVEFWLCLKRAGTLKCARLEFSGCRVRAPAARSGGAAGVSHDSPRAQTCTFEGPGLQKHHQNSTKRTNKRGRKE